MAYNLNSFVDMLKDYNDLRAGKIVLTAVCLNSKKKSFDVKDLYHDVKKGDTIHRYPLMFSSCYFRIYNKYQEFNEGSKYRFVILPIAMKRRGDYYKYKIELI